MSVLQIPVRVMKTLNAPTVTVLTAVLVNKDSLEMVQLVMVSENVLSTNHLSMNQAKRPLNFVEVHVFSRLSLDEMTFTGLHYWRPSMYALKMTIDLQ